MILRPHHLLCIRTFKGKGYSECFIQKMNEIVSEIKVNKVFSVLNTLDSICETCPNNSGTCNSENKVTRFDDQVQKILGIENKNYKYNQIEEIIQDRLTEEVFNRICSDCEWRKDNICSSDDMSKNWLTTAST